MLAGIMKILLRRASTRTIAFRKDKSTHVFHHRGSKTQRRVKNMIGMSHLQKSSELLN